MWKRPHVKRVCPGCYKVEQKVDDADYYTVSITRRDDLNGWIAAAQWDRCLYTDPVSTLRKAQREAVAMINGAVDKRLKRLVADNQTRARACGLV